MRLPTVVLSESLALARPLDCSRCVLPRAFRSVFSVLSSVVSVCAVPPVLVPCAHVLFVSVVCSVLSSLASCFALSVFLRPCLRPKKPWTPLTQPLPHTPRYNMREMADALSIFKHIVFLHLHILLCTRSSILRLGVVCCFALPHCVVAPIALSTASYSSKAEIICCRLRGETNVHCAECLVDLDVGRAVPA